MDQLRSGNEKELGKKPFTLGLWVGSASTPNTRTNALSALSQLEKDPNKENPFVLLQCPWCGAQMGPLEQPHTGSGRYRTKKSKYESPSVIGYVRSGTGPDRTVVYQCPDSACEFGAGSALSLASTPWVPRASLAISRPTRLFRAASPQPGRGWAERRPDSAKRDGG